MVTSPLVCLFRPGQRKRLDSNPEQRFITGSRFLLAIDGLCWRSGYTQCNPALEHGVHKTALSHLTFRRRQAVQLKDMGTRPF